MGPIYAICSGSYDLGKRRFEVEFTKPFSEAMYPYRESITHYCDGIIHLHVEQIAATIQVFAVLRQHVIYLIRLLKKINFSLHRKLVCPSFPFSFPFPSNFSIKKLVKIS